MERFDVVIVGAGIAGASLAARLASHGRVLLAEREARPGMHATGRSAAMFMESYGSPQGRALTRASRAAYLAAPPDRPVLRPRGCLYAGWAGQEAALEGFAALPGVQWLSAGEVLERVPVLRPEGLLGGWLEADAMEIDVDVLLQGCLATARRGGAVAWCDAELAAARREGSAWQITFADGRRVESAVLVNAAGAWADAVAAACGVAPLGLEPRRRSAFTFDAPPGLDARGWPLVCDADEGWYVKPDAGQLLGSPANADPVPPHDVVAEELDVALAIDRIQARTTLAIRRPKHTWAGLRTFSPDGEMVVGFDAAAPGFFWLAGQGGWGIQSAAGTAMLADALVTEESVPAELTLQGVDVRALAPDRLGSHRLRPLGY